ncbi:MAG: S26 family signal peptidase [Actinomycetota bacterium]|nr:S26 family signal peptidase [Actinomycetota bacterium]
MPAGETRYPRLWRGLSEALVAAGSWSSGPWRVAVKGLSMAPALLPGDRLLVCPARRLRRGDLVVLRDPHEPDRWVVKRVAALPGEQVVVAGRALPAGTAGLVVLGDNASQSTDSRQYGAVPLRGVHGRVWYRYAPPARSGRLPAR